MAPALLSPSRYAQAVTLRDGLLLVMATLKVALHALTNWRYGFHRDELYYVVGGLHPAWGYVDHPPLTPLVARAATELFGLSLSGLRLFPALAGAGVVVLTGLMVRRLGGSARAEAVAMLAVLLTPLYLGANSLFQTVSFDQLWWMALLFLVVCLAAGDSPRLWLLAGLVLGLGLLTKYTIVLLALGLLGGVLLTPLRSQLRTPWPWLGALLASLLALPNLLWQLAHNVPTLTFIRNNSTAVASEQSRLDLLLEQAMLIGPAFFPLFVAGWLYYWSAPGSTFRVLGWVSAVVFAAVITLNAKPYYVGPLYAALFAGGAVLADRWFDRLHGRRFGLLVVGLMLVASPLMLVTLPVLPTAMMTRTEIYALNDDFAEMLGWPELVDAVADAAAQLTPAERQAAQILTANYGQAAALELLGAERKLPTVISGHNSYATWSADKLGAETYLVVGYSAQRLGDWCTEVQQVGTISNVWNVPNEEHGRAIFICRTLRRPFSEIWPEMTHYN